MFRNSQSANRLRWIVLPTHWTIAANLSLYAAISSFGHTTTAPKSWWSRFLGTHLPLLAIIGFYLFRTTADMGIIWSTLAVALIATLVGTGITLFVLNQLLQPVLLTFESILDGAP